MHGAHMKIIKKINVIKAEVTVVSENLKIKESVPSVKQNKKRWYIHGIPKFEMKST